VTRGLFTAWLATFFSVFNIPVFWPILVLYFLALLIMTLRRQIGTNQPLRLSTLTKPNKTLDLAHNLFPTSLA
jgi:type IV secretory pathway VirB6-like protein